ncbi:g2445 [Coccomyxa elongata]
MTDFVTQYPALVRKLVLLAEDSGKDASAREQWQLCIAATPERDVSRQQSYHSLRAKAEYGLGELAAARADTELAHAPDPVKAGGLGVIVPSSPTLWASSTASYQGDVQLEMLGSVADRFDDFQLRVSGELCGLRDRVRSLEDRAPSLEDRRRSLEEGSMQSSQEGSMPSSLQGSLHSSPQTSPAATRQNSSSAQSLIPHTDRSGVDALPEPVSGLLPTLVCIEGGDALVDGDGPHGARVLPSGYSQVHHPPVAANTARQGR